MRDSWKYLVGVIVTCMVLYLAGQLTMMSPPAKPKDVQPFKKIGNITSKTGMAVEFYQLETDKFDCVIPIHTYFEDRRSAVPYIHCHHK